MHDLKAIKEILTLNSAIMMSTKLPTTIRASKEFQASIK